MKRFFNFLLLTTVLSGKAFADGFDLDLSLNGSAVVAKSFTRVDAEVAEGKAVVQELTATAKAIDAVDAGARININYSVVEDVYVGLSLGVQWDRVLSTPVQAQDSKGKDVSGIKISTKGTGLLMVPVALNIKYYVAEIFDDATIYAIMRVGALIGFDLEETKAGDIFVDIPDGSDLTLAEKSSASMSKYGWMANLGAGFEMFGASIEIAYQALYPGGWTGREYTAGGQNVKTAFSMSSHSVNVSLGYRFQELF